MKISHESKAGRNPLVFLFANTWRFSLGNRHNILLYWSLFIVTNAFQLIFLPLAMAEIINTIQKEGITNANFAFLCELLALTLFISIVFWALHGPARLIERANGFKTRANYRKFLLKGVMTLPMEWHAAHHSGDTIDRIEKGTQALYAFSVESFQIISLVVQFIVSYAMLAYFSPSAAFIVMAMIFLTVWITMRFDAVILVNYRELNRAENAVSESVYDSISNIATVIILRVERVVFEAIVAKIDKPFDLYRRTNRLTEMKWFLTTVACRLMSILVLATYFWQHKGMSQGVLIGSVYLLMRYLDEMNNIFYRFTGMYGDILIRRSRVGNSEELTPLFRDESFANHVLPTKWRNICVDGLDFSYPDGPGESLHLENISLQIRRGERIAFVGESGSGKTTLLKVMRSLYQPRTMELAVDGAKIGQGFEGICRAIALIPQNPEIFATTILDNITLGAVYSPEKVKQFADMACFSEVVEALPRQYSSKINERGVNLSGGQQQRLALARGLLASVDKSIVLLDEPTSSVDIGNEMKIYRNIFDGFKDTSVISSIHRLHLLPMFDRIYLFDKGRIVASGSLDELLATCTSFRTLWEQYNDGEQRTGNTVRV